MFWLSRCWKWFHSASSLGKKILAGKEVGKPYDYRNILLIIKAMIRDFKNREAWISNDLKAINHFPHLIVRPYWTPRGIRFLFFKSPNPVYRIRRFLLFFNFFLFAFTIPNNPLSDIECQANFSSSGSRVTLINRRQKDKTLSKMPNFMASTKYFFSILVNFLFLDIHLLKL